MCHGTKHCNAWLSLNSVGIAAEGCLRSPQWIQHLPFPPAPLTPHLYVEDERGSLHFIRTVHQGTFGYIDLARYDTAEGSTEVYVKRPVHKGKSLAQEACIKLVVRQSLEETGIPNGTPRVVRIFRIADGSVCFAMEQMEGAITLAAYLEATASHLFSYTLIDCLFQLSAMMWHLENRLGLNHRDLSPGNFLVVEHPPRKKILAVGTEVFPITTTHSLTLIDFGFSCIGSVDTHVSEFSLSTVYPPLDPCPKSGRDLFLFLALVYVDYYDRLLPTLRSLFESWLQEAGLKICAFMRKDREHSRHWLYFMVGNTSVTRFYSTPEQITRDLQELIA